MTFTRPDLPVPDEALRRARSFSYGNGVSGHDVQLMAAPVVAAVLREEADRIDREALRHPQFIGTDALLEAACRLRERAAQIDGD